MNDKKHIDKNDYILFHNNQMDRNETEEFLKHISSCDYCADQFATLMSEDIIMAPRDMKENLLKATRRPEVQIARRANETTKKMQLFWYSVKVGTATVCALLLLLLTINFADSPNQFKIISQENPKSFTTTLRNNMDNISNSMLNFSNNIMKTEVTDHDQKKK
jgi:hypothetical protein